MHGIPQAIASTMVLGNLLLSQQLIHKQAVGELAGFQPDQDPIADLGAAPLQLVAVPHPDNMHTRLSLFVWA